MRVDGVDAARRPSSTSRAPFATGLHQVDNPVFDRDGNLYVTYSGTRGQQVPVSIFRVRAERHARDVLVGHRQPDVDGVRSRRAACTCRAASRARSIASTPDGTAEPFAHGSRRRLRAGVRAGRHAVRRRSFGHDLPRRPRRPRDDVRVAAAERRGVSPRARPGRRAVRHRRRRCRRTTRSTASTPTATVTTRVRRRSAGRRGSPSIRGGSLYVVEALAGASGLYRVPAGRRARAGARRARPGRRRVRCRAAALVVASNDTAYRLTAAASVATDRCVRHRR